MRLPQIPRLSLLLKNRTRFKDEKLVNIDILPKIVWFFIVIVPLGLPTSYRDSNEQMQSPSNLLTDIAYSSYTNCRFNDSIVWGFFGGRYTKSLTFCLLKSLHALWIEAIVTVPYDQSMTNDIFCVMCVHYMYTICSRLLTTDSIIMHP